MANFRAKLNPFTGQLQLVNDVGILYFKESVATYADLPVVGNSKNDARITDDTGHLYIWSLDAPGGALTDWIDQGDILDLKWTSIEGRPSSLPADIDDMVTKGIKSLPAGDWLRVTSIEYNPTTGELRVSYEE